MVSPAGPGGALSVGGGAPAASAELGGVLPEGPVLFPSAGPENKHDFTRQVKAADDLVLQLLFRYSPLPARRTY